MQNKTFPATHVLYFSTRTSLKEIAGLVGKVALQLYAEAARQQLLPTGPIQWIYTGADAKPDTVFGLEIALPINGRLVLESSIKEKTLPEFNCLSAIHTGAWEHLYETYERLFDLAKERGLRPGTVCREQYTYMDFTEPRNNITEVMLGV